MNENVPKYTKANFLSLPINVNGGVRSLVYARLLKGLHDNEMISVNDIEAATDFIRRIGNNIDFGVKSRNTNVNGEDKFFEGLDHGIYGELQTAIAEAYESYNNDYSSVANVNWDEYWNESMSSLIKLLAEKIDPDTIRAYEKSGLLIEISDNPDKDGIIDTSHLRAGINIDGAYAALRIIDIMDADAGYSFAGDKDIYEFCRFYENITISSNLTYKGINVLFNEAANPILDKIRDGAKLSVEEVNLLNSYIISGVKEGTEDKYSINYNPAKFIISGEYETFKVARKPWVIPWYNPDGESYRRVRGEDKKLSVLTDDSKLGFTRKQSENGDVRWIRLLMPQYKRKVEVEDLNRNFWVISQVLTGITAIIFDDNGPINQMIKGLLKEIGQLWENMIYLWVAMGLLSQKRFYGETHSEVVMVSIAETVYQHLKYDGFDNIGINALAEYITPQLEYLLEMYRDYNLVILPQIRYNNYERNYYETIYFPGVFIYNRNDLSPHWNIYAFDDNGTGIKVALSDYSDYIYGLHEEEDTYIYLAPLSRADTLSPDFGKRFYGLVRDEIKLNASLYDYNEATDTWTDNLKIRIELNFFDLTKLISSTDTSLYYLIQDYKREKSEAEEYCGALGIDYRTDVVWGNIDMDHRQIYVDEEGYRETVYAGAETWDYYGTLYDVCFSPLKQRVGYTTPEKLDIDTEVIPYIDSLFANLPPGTTNIPQAIIDADAVRYNLIAMVTPSNTTAAINAISLSSVLHYIGKYGAVLLLEPEVQAIADNLYVSMNTLLNYTESQFYNQYRLSADILRIIATYNHQTDKIESAIIHNAIESRNPLDDILPTTIDIERGYYQGELLSTSKDVARIVYDIFTLPTAKLKPTTEDREDLKAEYALPSHATMRAEDQKVLETILTNFEEFNTDENFWTAGREALFTSPSYFYGMSGGSDLSAPRNQQPEKSYTPSVMAYNSLADWKNEVNRYYTTTKNIDDKTILFVEGNRGTNYASRGDSEAKHVYYFPYNGNSTDGLTSSYYENESINNTNTGAVISIPTLQGRVTSFYPNHLTIDGNGAVLNGRVYYTLQNKDSGGYYTTNSTLIPYVQVGTHAPAEFKRASSAAGGASEQWLVSLLNGERQVTPSNWLVTKIETPYVTRAKLLQNNALTGFEKFGFPGGNFSDEDFHKQLARRVAEDEYQANTANRTVQHIADVIKAKFIEVGIEDPNNPIYDMYSWYYDQAIQHGQYDDWYVEQCELYNNHNANNAWHNKVMEWCNIWDVTPTQRNSYGIKDPSGNAFSYRIFISVYINTDVKVYVFGPNGLYSRKCYSRNAAGKYTQSGVQYEETSDGNVDDIRHNYTVISNNVQEQNKEKYKSFHKLRANNSGTTPPYYTPSNDDDFGPTWYEANVQWVDIGTDYSWDIPT